MECDNGEMKDAKLVVHHFLNNLSGATEEKEI